MDVGWQDGGCWMVLLAAGDIVRMQVTWKEIEPGCYSLLVSAGTPEGEVPGEWTRFAADK